MESPPIGRGRNVRVPDWRAKAVYVAQRGIFSAALWVRFNVGQHAQSLMRRLLGEQRRGNEVRARMRGTNAFLMRMGSMS